MDGRDYYQCAGCGMLTHYTELDAAGKCEACRGEGFTKRKADHVGFERIRRKDRRGEKE